MTRIHNIGHIHNANFVQTQFSTSHPQKQHFLKSWKFTFLWKYSVCGLKFEISEYPIKLLYVTYSPYQYELERIKTHEMRAKNFPPFFFPSTVQISNWRFKSSHLALQNVNNELILRIQEVWGPVNMHRNLNATILNFERW